MSAPTSPSSRDQSSVSDAGLIAGFDGERDIRRAWVRGLTPDPQLTVSEWADKHRWLSSRASAEPGRYRTDRTPYMREIIDALSLADNPDKERTHLELDWFFRQFTGSNRSGYMRCGDATVYGEARTGEFWFDGVASEYSATAYRDNAVLVPVGARSFQVQSSRTVYCSR